MTRVKAVALTRTTFAGLHREWADEACVIGRGISVVASPRERGKWPAPASVRTCHHQAANGVRPARAIARLIAVTFTAAAYCSAAAEDREWTMGMSIRPNAVRSEVRGWVGQPPRGAHHAAIPAFHPRCRRRGPRADDRRAD